MIEIMFADCNNEVAIDLACSLVAKLIKSAIDELSPAENFFSPPAEKTKLKFHIVASGNSESPIYKFPPFDVDERITAMLRELMVK